MGLVIGVDGGGSGCRAALATLSGHVLGQGHGGPANIRTDLEGSRKNILQAVEQAFAEAGREKALIASTDAVLGLAGANVGDYRTRLIAMLPFRRCVIESDAEVSLEGALGSHDGAIAAPGTGSVMPAASASSRNATTQSRVRSSPLLVPIAGIFFSTSAGAVMMWQPISSASMTLNTSRVEAQMISMFFVLRARAMASFMIGR